MVVFAGKQLKNPVPSGTGLFSIAFDDSG